MLKNTKTYIYSEIETIKTNCFNCCFCCCYEPFFILCNYFFRNLLYINVFNLNLYKEKILLSPSRLLALYKPNFLIQF